MKSIVLIQCKNALQGSAEVNMRLPGLVRQEKWVFSKVTVFLVQIFHFVVSSLHRRSNCRNHKLFPSAYRHVIFKIDL